MRAGREVTSGPLRTRESRPSPRDRPSSPERFTAASKAAKSASRKVPSAGRVTSRSRACASCSATSSRSAVASSGRAASLRRGADPASGEKASSITQRCDRWLCPRAASLAMPIMSAAPQSGRSDATNRTRAAVRASERRRAASESPAVKARESDMSCITAPAASGRAARSAPSAASAVVRSR